MNNLTTYISEKLKLNKDIKHSSNIMSEECETILKTVGIENPQEEDDLEGIINCIENWLKNRKRAKKISYWISQRKTFTYFDIKGEYVTKFNIQNSQQFSTKFYNELGCIEDDSYSNKEYTVFRTYDGYLFICKPDYVNGKKMITPVRAIKIL